MCRQTKMRKPILYERELELPQFRSRPLGGTPWHDGRKAGPRGTGGEQRGRRYLIPIRSSTRPRSPRTRRGATRRSVNGLRIVTRQYLMVASGDPRDWFRYGHRLQAYEEAWLELIDARSRRRDFMADFTWNQILVLGDYGSGKTTLATHLARHFLGCTGVPDGPLHSRNQLWGPQLLTVT